MYDWTANTKTPNTDKSSTCDNNDKTHESNFDNYLQVFLSNRYINCCLFPVMDLDKVAMCKRLRRINNFFQEGCFIKSLGIGAGAGVVGLLFGCFMFGIKPIDIDTTQAWQTQIKQTYSKFVPEVKKTGVGCMKLGFLYSFFDCLIARERAKQDIYAAMLAGCLTGGSLAWRGGPTSVISGCLGFGTFSAVVERLGPRLLGSAGS